MLISNKKALYGLKQASRVWNIKLNQKLKRMGLKRSKYDMCVYYKMESGGLQSCIDPAERKPATAEDDEPTK